MEMGFRNGYLATDHLQALDQLFEKLWNASNNFDFKY